MNTAGNFLISIMAIDLWPDATMSSNVEPAPSEGAGSTS